MKRLLALALAAIMMLASAALAEAARVMTFSDPVASVTVDGEQKTADLTGVSLRVAAGKPGGIPTVQLDITYNDRQMQGAVIQFADGRAYIEADGLSQPLCADLDTAGLPGQRAVDAAFDHLDHLMDFKLPAFTGVKIPKIDLISLAPMLGARVETNEKGVQTADFQVPYAMVRQLMGMAVQYRDAVPESAKRYSDALFDAAEDMMAGDSGFALKGTITAKKKSSRLAVDIYPVRGGVTADSPSVGMNFVSARNRADFSVELLESGSPVSLLDFALRSSPKSAELSFSLDAMGLLVVAGSLYPQDGAQVAALELSALGKKLGASLTYGPTAYGEFADFALELSDRLNVAAGVDVSYDENGDSAGTFALNAMATGVGVDRFDVRGGVFEGVRDVGFRGVSRRDGAIDLIHMSGEQRERLAKELRGLVDGMLKRAGLSSK